MQYVLKKSNIKTPLARPLPSSVFGRDDGIEQTLSDLEFQIRATSPPAKIYLLLIKYVKCAIYFQNCVRLHWER